MFNRYLAMRNQPESNLSCARMTDKEPYLPTAEVEDLTSMYLFSVPSLGVSCWHLPSIFTDHPTLNVASDNHNHDV